jgi:hypothetical protein
MALYGQHTQHRIWLGRIALDCDRQMKFCRYTPRTRRTPRYTDYLESPRVLSPRHSGWSEYCIVAASPPKRSFDNFGNPDQSITTAENGAGAWAWMIQILVGLLKDSPATSMRWSL